MEKVATAGDRMRWQVGARGCRGIASGIVLALLAARAPCATAQEPAAAALAPAAVVTSIADPIRDMQVEAERTGTATWGHWGDQPERYDAWSNHSNRLVPVYTFGLSLDDVRGGRSVYRDAARLRTLYGFDPAATLDPTAEHFDQTDVHHLMRQAAAAGKKRIVLFVFDGLDWPITRAAAIAATGTVAYDEGRGTGLAFQDYRGAPTDFGWCVTSPANSGTTFDVDAQAVVNPGGTKSGGYDPVLGGRTPWDAGHDLRYLIGRTRDRPHAVTDSSASATSLCSGRKIYNDGVNVGPDGTPIEPIARVLQREGWAVGAVSSVPVSHATPACAYATNVSRDDYQDISRDMLGCASVAHRAEPLPGLDVLIGAGHGVRNEADADQGRNFEPGNKYVADSTVAAIDAAAGGRYVVAQRTAGRRGADVLAAAAREAAAGGLRLFGFFGTAQGNLPFRTADGRYDPAAGPPDAEADRLRKKYGGSVRYSQADLEENPTLADMTRTALDLLGTRERFWLLVEPGDVDWAAHANNIDACIGAVHSGDDAFRACVGWIETHGGWDDAAVIVTSDHGHLFVLTEPAAFARPAR
jgi:alkaline phosphatase